VTLGVRPMDVAFRHRNGGLSAKVYPQAGAGPWVMRVDVRDQFGMPLGRDFVEIIRGPNKPKTVVPTIQKQADHLSRR
jgi:hypothetical protein